MLYYLYRFEDHRVSVGYDEINDCSIGSRAEVTLRAYKIIKRTPKGAWIQDFCRKRFVRLTARKKFACETREEALESFRARKRRQIRILQEQIGHARSALSRAERMEPKAMPAIKTHAYPVTLGSM